jgi:two-component system cell cycle response regulator DivK
MSASERVLVVEDNEKNMKLVRDVLRFHGFDVSEAATGAEGVRRATSDAPDLILMDIQLPDIDGVTALQQIRADPTARRCPIVALTAFAMHNDRRKFIEAGFDGYLTKPISVRELPVRVREFLELARVQR